MTLAYAARPDAPAYAERIEAERLCDRAAVDRLIDRAFGPGRFAKTAERLREGARPRLDLSACAWSQGEIMGAVRQWTVRIGAADAIFLGPIAVDESLRRQGLGAALISHACDAAGAAGEGVILLVGAADFFKPLGFQQVPPGRVAMPGAVDPARLLWRALRPGALDGVAGRAGARPFDRSTRPDGQGWG